MYGSFGLLNLLFGGSAIILVVAQAILLDYDMAYSDSPTHWCWLVGDISLASGWIIAWVRGRTTSDEPNFLFLQWLLYSALLSCKVGVSYFYVDKNLSTIESLGPNFLRIAIYFTAVIFICLKRGSVNHARNTLLHYYIDKLEMRTFLDIMDSSEFLGAVFTERVYACKAHVLLVNGTNGTGAAVEAMSEINEINLCSGLTISIIVFGAVGLVIPVFALLETDAVDKVSSPCPIDKDTWKNPQMWYLSSALVLNLAFLIIRICLWAIHDHAISVLLAKNAIFMFVNAFDIAEAFYY